MLLCVLFYNVKMYNSLLTAKYSFSSKFINSCKYLNVKPRKIRISLRLNFSFNIIIFCKESRKLFCIESSYLLWTYSIHLSERKYKNNRSFFFFKCVCSLNGLLYSSVKINPLVYFISSRHTGGGNTKSLKCQEKKYQINLDVLAYKKIFVLERERLTIFVDCKR